MNIHQDPRQRRSLSLLRRKGGSHRERALFNSAHILGEEVASAATISLKDPSCRVTGTATISAIAETRAGEERTVIFSSACTLTHSANLILPTSANITTAANDSADFISLGDGVWKCKLYTLANGTPLGVVPIVKGGSGQTTAVAAIDAFHTAGADVASAGTVNLDTATGQVVTITGSTTITDITLAEGKVRRCRLSGAPKITYNASKILIPGAADIQGAANDTFEAVGKASSIVEIRNYIRAAVSPLVANLYQPTVRMSLSSISPVQTSDSGPQQTISVLPFMGNQLPLYNGVEWVSYVFSEMVAYLTVATNGTTTNGSKVVTGIDSSLTPKLCRGMDVTGTGIAANSVIASIDSATQVTLNNNATATGTNTITYKVGTTAAIPVDVFAVLQSGTPTVRVVPWSLATSRSHSVTPATGTGLYTNLAAINATDFNGIAAGQGLYLGSAYVSAGVTYDEGAQTSSTGSKRWLWNYFNRRARWFKVIDTTNSWNYSTASYQQANASANNQASFMVGISEDPVICRLSANVSSSGATNRQCSIGIGLDSTSANSADTYDNLNVDNSNRRPLKAEYVNYPGIGYHYLAWLEQGGGADTQSWLGDNGGTLIQTGMTGWVMG